METITIPKHEYLEMQIKINHLSKKLALLQDQEFLSKLELAYHFFIHVKNQFPTNYQPVSIKRGSVKPTIIPKPFPITCLEEGLGCVKYEGKAKSLEEMEEGIIKAARQQWFNEDYQPRLRILAL